MTRFFDTHAHLFDERFATDLPEVMDRAQAAGVVTVAAIGIDRVSSLQSVEIARKYPDHLIAAVGIQPNHVAECEAGDWETIVALAESRGVVRAIGETGLDRYWDRTPFPDQEVMFIRHLELAYRLQLPVVIHCREAEADVVRVLRMRYEQTGPVAGVMHSFTGDEQTARQCLEMGLHISFAGMVTYKTAENLRAIARIVPSDRLLVETDCPYLAPVPCRGKRNEPAFVVHTARMLAETRGEPWERLAEQTTINASSLFGVSQPPV